MKINKENIVRYAAVAILAGALTVGGIEVYDAQINHTQIAHTQKNTFYGDNKKTTIQDNNSEHMENSHVKIVFCHEDQQYYEWHPEMYYGLRENNHADGSVSYAPLHGADTIVTDVNSGKVYAAKSEELISINLQIADGKYFVPQGSVIEIDGSGNMYRVWQVQVRVKATEVQIDDGSIIYTVPNGYVLKTDEIGNMVGVVLINYVSENINTTWNDIFDDFAKTRK